MVKTNIISNECKVGTLTKSYQVTIVDELARTNATPSQESLLASPRSSTIMAWTSATMVLSSEKRNVADKMVTTIMHHLIFGQLKSATAHFMERIIGLLR